MEYLTVIAAAIAIAFLAVAGERRRGRQVAAIVVRSAHPSVSDTYDIATQHGGSAADG